MVNAQQAANEEDKSSVGDKYETGRAMMQIERDKAAQQLDEALKLKNIIDQISVETGSGKIMLGSLVITNSKKIFISIGIGKLFLDDEEFLVVAPGSPLGPVAPAGPCGPRTLHTIAFSKDLQLLPLSVSITRRMPVILS